MIFDDNYIQEMDNEDDWLDQEYCTDWEDMYDSDYVNMYDNEYLDE